MNLTREKAIAEHRKMWHWIATETERRHEVVAKDEYMRKYYSEETIENDCFCCEYDIQHDGECISCPIEWLPHGQILVMCALRSSVFKKWINAFNTNNWQEAARYARGIAELPERKEGEGSPK